VSPPIVSLTAESIGLRAAQTPGILVDAALDADHLVANHPAIDVTSMKLKKEGKNYGAIKKSELNA
jgi:hypothetical protein